MIYQISDVMMSISTWAGAQLGGGGGLPCPFLKIKKSAPILQKNAPIVSILRLKLPFNM